MLAKIYSAAVYGVDAYEVEIEVNGHRLRSEYSAFNVPSNSAQLISEAHKNTSMKSGLCYLLLFLLGTDGVFCAEDVDSYVAQAEASIRNGDTSQAVSAYEKALDINPADSSVSVKLGMLCLNYYLQNRGIGDSMDFLYKARDAFNKAIRLNSLNPEAYLGRGVVFDQLVKPEQALADLTKAIELDPKNPEAYKRRGDVFYRMDRNEQALSDYTKALAIRPNYRDALAARDRAQKEVEKNKADH